jgi:hypothetical protein
VSFQASGGTAPYTWSSSNLPAGWQISASGQLTAPAGSVQTGTYNFDVSVTDSDPAGATTVSQPFSVTVDPLPTLQVQTTTLPNGTEGYSYTSTITATGGTGSGYTWTLVSGTLPPGISGIPGTGTPGATLGGQPGATGLFTFHVQVTDDIGNTAVAPLSIMVEAPALGGGSSGGGGASGCTASGAAAGWWWLVWLIGGVAFLHSKRVLARR